MFRNHQIVKYPPLHVLRLTLTPLPIPRIQHLPFDIPNAASRLGYRFSPDGFLTRHIAIGVPVACAAGLKKFFMLVFKNARSLSDIVFVTRRRRCGRMRGRRPGKTGGVFAGIH